MYAVRQQGLPFTRCAFLVAFAILLVSTALAEETSTCYGRTSNGSLSNGWKLPASGSNFSSYSTIGRMAGRTYVHSSVHEIVVEAYQALEATMPDTVYVYGETGSSDGGPFEPHKTHQNGLSVDFMVPVLDDDGKSVELPTHVLNKWGYALEFDERGKLDELKIDYEAIAQHLYQLHSIAIEKGFEIWRVIFDPTLQKRLKATSRWGYLSENLQFSTKRSWVRHDEHYHVDFSIPCEPVV